MADVVDWYQVGTIIVGLIAAGGGGKAWVESRKAKKAGMPADEQVARATAPAADWLTDHYRQEVEALRADMRSELTQTRLELSEERALAEQLREKLHKSYEDIAKMEQHIWLRKPPPPPARKS